jgi:RNA recognition motif-containing protein
MDSGSRSPPNHRREGNSPTLAHKTQTDSRQGGTTEDPSFRSMVAQSQNSGYYDGEDFGPQEHDEPKIQLFVGGLPSQVTEKILYDHFSQYGKLVECRLVLDKNTLKSRGFGFVSFQNNQALHVVTQITHKLCGKEVECKPALSKQDSNQRVNEEKSKKVFVGGLPLEATESDLYDYFKKFGDIKACRIIYKHESSISRGFGFVIFGTKEIADEVLMKKDQHYIKGVWVDCKSAILRREMEVMNLMNKSMAQNGGNMNMIVGSHPHSPVHRPSGRNPVSSYQDVPESFYPSNQGSNRGKNWPPYASSSSSSRGGYNQHNPRMNYDYSNGTRSPTGRMESMNYGNGEYDQQADYRYDEYGSGSRGHPQSFQFPGGYGSRGRGHQPANHHGQFESHGHLMNQQNVKIRGNPVVRGGAPIRNPQSHQSVPIEHHYVPVHDGNTSPHGNHSPQHGSPRRQPSPDRVESPGNISPTGYYNNFAAIAPSQVYYVGGANNNTLATGGISPRRLSDNRESFSPVRQQPQTVHVEMGYANQISPRHNRNMNEGRPPVPGEMSYGMPTPIMNMPIPTIPREQSPKRPFYSPLGAISPGKQPPTGLGGTKEGNISPGGIGTIPGSLAHPRGMSPQQPRNHIQGKINLKLIDDHNQGELEHSESYNQNMNQQSMRPRPLEDYRGIEHHQEEQEHYDYHNNQGNNFQIMPRGNEDGEEHEGQGGYGSFFAGHPGVAPGYKPGEVSSSTNSPKHVEYRKYFSPTQRGREPRAPQNYPKQFKIRQGQQGGEGTGGNN